MGNNEQTEIFVPENYSVSELIELRKRALAKQEELVADWAKELGEIMKEPGFDQYSRKGERRLNKFTEKHAALLADVLDAISMIDDELEKRDEHRFRQSFSDSDENKDIESMTTEEFLKYEQQRIEESRKYISTIDDEEDDY